MFPARANSDSAIAMCLQGLPAWCHSVTKGAIAVVGLAGCSNAAGGAVVSGKVWKVVCFVFVALFAAGCGGGGDDDASAVTLPPVEESAEAETTSATTTTAPDTTTTSAVLVEEEAQNPGRVISVEVAEELWVNAWQTAGLEASSVDDIEAFTSAEVAAGLRATLGAIDRSIDNFPAVSEPDENGVVVVHDCLVSFPPFFDAASTWYSGEVTLSEDGEPQITSFSVESTDPCVPAEISDSVIVAYLESRTAEAEFLASETADISILDAGTIGDRADFLSNLGQRAIAENFVILGLDKRQWNPHVFEFSNQGIEIGDCYEVDESFGAFDRTTAERTDLIALPVDGQRNADVSVMVFDEGGWKMSANDGRTNVDCDLDSADLRLAVIDVGGERPLLEET